MSIKKEIGYQQALDALHSSEALVDGKHIFLACPTNSDNYYSLWTRDAMVTTVGVVQSGDDSLIQTAHNSWQMLRAAQTDRGRIPAYISLANPEAPEAEFGGWGRIETLDSQMWYVIGAKHLFTESQDSVYISTDALSSYKKALELLEYRTSERHGLVDWPVSAGWDDQMQRRHHVLSLESLRILAYEAASDLFAAAGDVETVTSFQKKVASLREKVQDTFWIDQDKASWLFAHATLLNGSGYFSANAQQIFEYVSEFPTSFFTSYLAPYEITPTHLRFDTYANILAILAGVATDEQATLILDYMQEKKITEPWPVRVLDPVIQRDDADYHIFYEFGRNKPYQYQNGAIWPHITGLYILALQKMGRQQEATAALEAMRTMLAQPGHAVDAWGFNEYYHGQTGEPGLDAHDNQAWSAGGLLYALSAVVEGTVIF